MKNYSVEIVETVKQLAELTKQCEEIMAKVNGFVKSLDNLLIYKDSDYISFNIRTIVKGKSIRFVKRGYSRKIEYIRGRDSRPKAWVFLLENIDQVIKNLERLHKKHKRIYDKQKDDMDSWDKEKWEYKLRGEVYLLKQLKRIQRVISLEKKPKNKWRM